VVYVGAVDVKCTVGEVIPRHEQAELILEAGSKVGRHMGVGTVFERFIFAAVGDVVGVVGVAGVVTVKL
jgi:hypothetical protein